MLRIIFILLFATHLFARAPVYVVLWFDTEDYIEPAADDAVLHIATDLTDQGVRATFKVVGERARVLEARHRDDVIRALSRHAIGFHSNFHSFHPTPAEYLRKFGYLEGAAEFERREGPGVADIERVFGVKPVCYGQPGSSWGPQSNLALRRLGIPVYLDEGTQVGLNEQPFWYGGMLYVFHMGQNNFRAELNVGDEDKAANQRFDEAVSRLSSRGGGVISIYYHPTEFVTTEFWDAVNFAHGAMPARQDWRRPHLRTPQDTQRCFHVLHSFVQHMKQTPGVSFVTAQDLPQIYADAIPPQVDSHLIAEQLRGDITFLETADASISPADMLVQLLGLRPRVVDGPTAPGSSTWRGSHVIPAHIFAAAKKDAANFIEYNGRLPNQVFLGAETLSLPDFAATLAESVLHPGAPVHLIRGHTAFEKYFSSDPRKSFSWPIHPEGFSAEELLDLGRLQGWTLKPAKLR